MPVLETDVWVPRAREEVFAFFEDPANLARITPPWLGFRMLPPKPRRMRKGALVSYLLRVRGVPVWWLTRIVEHDPPRRFVDRQLAGPYLRWVHTHAFEPERGGTRVRDRVDYRHLGGAWVEDHVVRPDLEAIFSYRRLALERLFGEGSVEPGRAAARAA